MEDAAVVLSLASCVSVLLREVVSSDSQDPLSLKIWSYSVVP